MRVITNATLDRFEVRPTVQREWRTLILIALFFGGVGSGLFLVSQFFSFTFGVVLALVIVAGGMGGAYLCAEDLLFSTWHIEYSDFLDIRDIIHCSFT